MKISFAAKGQTPFFKSSATELTPEMRSRIIRQVVSKPNEKINWDVVVREAEVKSEGIIKKLSKLI